MSTQAPTPKLSGPSMGLCPACGSIQSKEWISGMYGWICGSFSDSHEGRPILFHQSLACASMYWRISAEKAERERDEARSEIKAVKDILWPNQTGLPNEHRNAAVAVDAIKRLSERQIAAQAAQIAQLREALERIRAILQSTSHPHEALAITTEALSFPPPPVVPLEDAETLSRALEIAIPHLPSSAGSAKARHLAVKHGNTSDQFAFETALRAYEQFTAKHPLP